MPKHKKVKREYYMHTDNYIDHPILIKEDFNIPVLFAEFFAHQKSLARQKSLREAKKTITIDKARWLWYSNQLDLEALKTKI